ncbi:MAG: polysaccharide biosynthesis protein, partial [Tetrasphaera sp.]|nr:polysaccharide biosynthesis protein [Tetrasphaera sp.]
MAERFNGATVTITGGTGSFGSTMVRALLEHGADQIRVLSRDEAKQ